MQRTNLIIYFWLALTAAIVIIPCAYLLYILWNKSSDFIERKAQVIKENKELKNIKSDLEEQKDEFIASNEYWTFIAPDDEKKEEEVEEAVEEEKTADVESSILTVKENTDEKLEQVKNQNIDITNFEEKINTFKNGFGRNYRLASERFEKAIEEIDKTIDHLEKIKENLKKTDDNLRLANNKIEDLTIKKLTYNNETMKNLFDSLKEE